MAEQYISERGNPYKRFRFIHNGNASAALQRGDVVEYARVSATPEHVGQTVVDGTAADVLVAGVVVGKSINGKEDIPAGEFGWIQVAGFCDFVTTDGTIVEGDLLISGAAVADAGTLGTNDGAAFGVALDADAATTLTAAIIRLVG